MNCIKALAAGQVGCDPAMWPTYRSHLGLDEFLLSFLNGLGPVQMQQADLLNILVVSDMVRRGQIYY